MYKILCIHIRYLEVSTSFTLYFQLRRPRRWFSARRWCSRSEVPGLSGAQRSSSEQSCATTCKSEAS